MVAADIPFHFSEKIFQVFQNAIYTIFQILPHKKLYIHKVDNPEVETKMKYHSYKKSMYGTIQKVRHSPMGGRPKE